jgi:uncharacterized protein
MKSNTVAQEIMATDSDVSTARVGHIPVLWIEPKRRHRSPSLALWVPPFSFTKEWTVPFLRELADEGFVAVSLDPFGHGQRTDESAEDLRTRVMGDFRRQMWPILGQTTLDCLRVFDWAIEALGVGPEGVAGGISMGGDIAIALAGIDHRVDRVAAVVASPDWNRPGMHDLSDPARVLPQGSADAYAQWFYNELDPLTHLDRYLQRPAISFECGQDDTHISPGWAIHFRDMVLGRSTDSDARIRVTVHPGLGHIDAAQDPAIHRRSLAWLMNQ